jgi:hypothetical protein
VKPSPLSSSVISSSSAAPTPQLGPSSPTSSYSSGIDSSAPPSEADDCDLVHIRGSSEERDDEEIAALASLKNNSRAQTTPPTPTKYDAYDPFGLDPPKLGGGAEMSMGMSGGGSQMKRKGSLRMVNTAGRTAWKGLSTFGRSRKGAAPAQSAPRKGSLAD